MAAAAAQVMPVAVCRNGFRSVAEGRTESTGALKGLDSGPPAKGEGFPVEVSVLGFENLGLGVERGFRA